MKFTKDYIFISRSLHKKLGDKFVAIRKEAERIHMEFLFLEKDDLRDRKNPRTRELRNITNNSNNNIREGQIRSH